CLLDGASGLSDNPTADELLTRPWVHNLTPREGMGPARQQLQFRGIDISVAAVTPHFFVMPSLIVGTDRVALVPEVSAVSPSSWSPASRWSTRRWTSTRYVTRSGGTPTVASTRSTCGCVAWSTAPAPPYELLIAGIPKPRFPD